MLLSASVAKKPNAGRPRGKKMVAGLVMAGASLLSHVALATACIVSDPYAHTGDQPIAGTYSTASGAALATTTVDTHVFSLYVSACWPLSLFQPGVIFIVH